MKASTLLVRGALGALAGVAAAGHTQPPLASSDLRLSTRTATATQQNAARARATAPPAPRGDIASNVRARPDNDREERSPQH
ncbi:hypothetical protein [Caballeronia sp. LZ016]|uniref:hypothetical protein n=1 Tax=Caballeronia sp. LZ016 TaxID=3038554 RepID=UPI002864EB63|nr:hypothetical protein [Caballeronia sp. LZ016]MDR5738159.1 hypothetical protein [Caballeronia sp. LZ016]